MAIKVPEHYRKTDGILGSDSSYGNSGVFIVPYEFKGKGVPQFYLQCIASDGKGWEHVSVSVLNKNRIPTGRCPTWDEMNYIKDLFWKEEDCVVQFHPPKSVYVNRHKYVLHLWRKIGVKYETPPQDMI